MTDQTASVPAPVRPTKAPIAAGASVSAIVPRDVDEAWRLSRSIVLAGMVPTSYDGKTEEETQAKVMIGIMKGMEVGLPPVTALSTIAVINNRPCIWGDGAIALVHASGKLEWMRETVEGEPNTDTWTAVCEMKRAGQETVYRRTFSFGQAKRANLTGKPGPWRFYPERMMQMRARAFCVRDGFADVLSGLSIAEEVQDMPTEKPAVDAAAILGDDAPAPTAQIEHQPVVQMPAPQQESETVAAAAADTPAADDLFKAWDGEAA